MFVGLDLTKADIVPEGTYVATITRAEVKLSKKGVEYISWLFYVPELGQNIFHSTSFSAPRMIKQVLDAAGVNYSAEGFDPDDAVGAQVKITVGVTEDPEYGYQNVVSKITKV